MVHNRRNWLVRIGFTFASIGLAKLSTFAAPANDLLPELTEALPDQLTVKAKHMKLGAFSISRNVRNITASKQFYENLGF